jgi:hypothetical protein
MSIKVGYLNEKYTLNNLQNENNKLILNSFFDSNVILINNEKNTCQDMYISYQDNFFTGVSSNSYVFRTKEENLQTINNSNITLYKPTYILDNLHVKNILNTSNDGVYINSNLIINFVSPSDKFRVSDILQITSNYAVQYNISNMSLSCGNKPIMNIDNSTISMSNNVYVYNGTLYANKIEGLNGSLNFENVTYGSTSIDNFKATKSFIVANALTDNIDITPFQVYKKNGNADLLSINTCNMNNTITNRFIINNKGQVGIGTQSPDASLTISNVYGSNVINYKGTSSGDVFRLTNRGNVGIGTSVPNAHLHICRNDDLTDNQFRKNPMINIDMNFNPYNNISNLYTYYTSSVLTDNTMTIYPYTVVSSNLSNGLNVNVDNTFYLLNQGINSVYSLLDNNIYNISNINLSKEINLTLPIIDGKQPLSTAATSITLNNSIVYPASDRIHIDFERSTYSAPDAPEYEVRYSLLMMSKETKINGGYINNQTLPNYNADNFTLTISKLNKRVVYSILGYNITCSIDFIIEKNFLQNGNLIPYYTFDYEKIERVQLPAPDFWTISSNNTFVSSLSAHGTLSLGTNVPANQSEEYLLYAPGKGLLNSLNINSLNTTQANNNISVSDKNLVNVNRIECTSLEATNLTFNAIDITNLQGTKLSMQEGIFSNLASSNIEFYTLNNDYLNFSYKNAHFKTRCSIGNSKELNNQNCMKITVDNQIVATNTVFESTPFYTRHNGISVYNESDGINPCISIATINANTTPYLHMSNGASGYYFRVKKTMYNNNNVSTTNFQIVTDDLKSTIRKNYYSQPNIDEPYFFQHIKDYDLLTLGEQNIICIDTLNKRSMGLNNTNSSSKVAIGLPYGVMSSYVDKDHPVYFKNVINNKDTNPYMLNIFGNVKMANIMNSPMFTAKTNDVDNNIYTAINGEPDNVNTLRVFGITATSNLTVYSDVNASKIYTSNLTVYNDVNASYIYTSNLTVYNDMNTSNIYTSNLRVYNDVNASYMYASNLTVYNDVNASNIYASNLTVYNDIIINVPGQAEPVSLATFLQNYYSAQSS